MIRIEMAAAMKSIFSKIKGPLIVGGVGSVDSEGDVDLGAVYHGCGV